MYIYKNEHNRQQTDDWLWDTIPNNVYGGNPSEMKMNLLVQLSVWLSSSIMSPDWIRLRWNRQIQHQSYESIDRSESDVKLQ